MQCFLSGAGPDHSFGKKGDTGMLNMIREKIGVRITLQVSLVMLLLMAGGTVFILKQQGRVYEAQLLSRGWITSVLGAKAVSRILEEGVDNGVLTIEDVMDTDYQEIPGFEPKKFHTKYDWYTDKALLPLEDEVLKSPELLYAAAQDIKGYVPTHNTRFQQPPSGNLEKDLKGNRTKRIYEDPVALRASKNTTEGYVQDYPRDTGERVWDISTPIYVKGRHWGAFRIGMDVGTIEKQQRQLAISLSAIMATVLIVALLMLFILIHVALRPISRFTQIAQALADGDLDQKIEHPSQDEMGRLADVLERLRISLKAAIDRLRRNS
jgi:methyl-accepting chemotaxis protein